ncbi:MAG: acyl carrier protein [Deltaproteobacteria bacterium]|nr:acyl carrier protein [Deltaproteobacteria bacterium]
MGNELIRELKHKIFKRLNISDVHPDELDDDRPLTGDEFDIDSIDILEILVMIDDDYGVRIENREEGIEAFASFRALADYIETHRSRE